VDHQLSADEQVMLVADVSSVAMGVITVRLVAPDGGLLTPWTPGAHVRCVLPSGRVRPFSLCGDPTDRHAYVVAVQRNDSGEGGSREMHAEGFAGSPVLVDGPFNSFELGPAAGYVFIAGGIGIAPIRPMAHEANRRGIPWRLLYAGRTREEMAFVDELSSLAHGSLEVVTLGASQGVDLARHLAMIPPDHHVYCCGSGALVRAVEHFCAAHLAPDTLHTESCQWPEGAESARREA
jgi:ferredoxin-NADP reductase